MMRPHGGTEVKGEALPLVCGGDGLGRLYPNVRVPLPWRQDDDLIQELLDAGQQVLPVLGLVGDVVEHLAPQTPEEEKHLSNRSSPTTTPPPLTPLPMTPQHGAGAAETNTTTPGRPLGFDLSKPYLCCQTVLGKPTLR